MGLLVDENLDIYEEIIKGQASIAIVGLGYVGLPLAVAFSKKAKVIGFDLSKRKITNFQSGIDLTGDVGNAELSECSIQFTTDVNHLADAKFFVVAVPTPVLSGNVPDLSYIQSASQMVGSKLSKGAIVVFESTVYPGVTEDVCIPILEAESGLKCGKDFKVGYSPERINPGDTTNKLENIIKIVSGIDEESLETIARLYELVIDAGIHKAKSIKVAEAAKVIENAQRDINIAFMNEISMLFHQMGIDTKEVLQAAGTKWNFHHYTPGLVGGHCIGIDPYYLTYKAETEGYHSKIILAGRHINDGMSSYIVQQIIKMLVQYKLDIGKVNIGFFGVTYKENSSDIRNSKVIDIIKELQEYGVNPKVVDPLVDKKQFQLEYDIELMDIAELENLNVIIMAAPHQIFTDLSLEEINDMYDEHQTKVMIDIKGVYDKAECEHLGYRYWRL